MRRSTTFEWWWNVHHRHSEAAAEESPREALDGKAVALLAQVHFTSVRPKSV